ncbi:DUF1772 domain-containing protein [Flagellimonas profundi]|uniref:DUF1772 domain-containing protein n=1 Tax=Flagellimonas profundi TaxID=2915620 RepID=A0ABS3FJZ7_9FLAO|nr:DUF1772 domain-containing protein [Allomuricauda profundi]MBO0343490.1 DUF1772 domain-containing protein [Allomuricauda profundi]
MNRTLKYFSMVTVSVFLGGQITEGLFLVPHWKGLAPEQFYLYYAKFGPSIGYFYTGLTLAATLVPLLYSVKAFYHKDLHLPYFVLSTFFMLTVIVLFFIFFKSTNQHFYAADLNAATLKLTLETWEIWHWIRILLEMISLILLLYGLNTFEPCGLKSNLISKESQKE